MSALLVLLVVVGGAIVLWLASSYPRPWLYLVLALTPTQFIFVPVSTFFLSPADVLVLAATPGLLLRLARRESRAWEAARLHLPLAVMLLGYVAGFLALDHFSRTIVRVPMAIVPSVLACELLRTRGHFARVTAALIAAGVLDATYGVIWYSSGQWLHPNRFSGMMGVNFSAIVILVAALAAFARFGGTVQPLKLLLPVGLTILALATLSKMGMIAFVVGISGLVLSGVVTRENARLLAACVLIVVVAALAHSTLRERVLARAQPELQQDGVPRSSTYVRMVILRAAWRGFTDQPLVGVGYFNFARYSTTEPAIMASTYGEGYATHNTYLEVLVEGGLLAFVPFLWFFWRRLYRLPSAWRAVTHPPDPVMAAALAGLPVVLLSAAAANVLLHYLFWGVCGVAFACIRTVGQGGGEHAPRQRTMAAA